MSKFDKKIIEEAIGAELRKEIIKEGPLRAFDAPARAFAGIKNLGANISGQHKLGKANAQIKRSAERIQSDWEKTEEIVKTLASKMANSSNPQIKQASQGMMQNAASINQHIGQAVTKMQQVVQQGAGTSTGASRSDVDDPSKWIDDIDPITRQPIKVSPVDRWIRSFGSDPERDYSTSEKGKIAKAFMDLQASGLNPMTLDKKTMDRLVAFNDYRLNMIRQDGKDPWPNNEHFSHILHGTPLPDPRMAAKKKKKKKPTDVAQVDASQQGEKLSNMGAATRAASQDEYADAVHQNLQKQSFIEPQTQQAPQNAPKTGKNRFDISPDMQQKVDKALSVVNQQMKTGKLAPVDQLKGVWAQLKAQGVRLQDLNNPKDKAFVQDIMNAIKARIAPQGTTQTPTGAKFAAPPSQPKPAGAPPGPSKATSMSAAALPPPAPNTPANPAQFAQPPAPAGVSVPPDSEIKQTQTPSGAQFAAPPQPTIKTGSGARFAAPPKQGQVPQKPEMASGVKLPPEDDMPAVELPKISDTLGLNKPSEEEALQGLDQDINAGVQNAKIPITDTGDEIQAGSVSSPAFGAAEPQPVRRKKKASAKRRRK